MEQKRLGDIATYINGYAFKPKDRGKEGLPIIRIQDLTGNSYDLGFYNGDYPNKIEINNGDVLISWSASLGVYIWDRGKALLNQHIFKVVFDKVEVNKQYFVFVVRYNLKKMLTKTHGATMKHIVKKDFDNIIVPFPSMEKQKEIAEILLKVSAIISFRNQELQKLDELIKSRFVEMFGDPIINNKKLPVEKMNDRYYLKAGITTPANTIHDYMKGQYEIPCYGGNGIRGYVEEKSYKGCYPIIGRQGALCGNVQYASGEFHATEHAVLVSLLKNDNVIWTYYMLKMMDLYRYHTGAAQPGLAVKTLNTIEIIVADINLQNQFAAFVEQVNKSKVEVQKALDQAQLLFDSLMQKYFG